MNIRPDPSADADTDEFPKISTSVDNVAGAGPGRAVVELSEAHSQINQWL